MHRAEHRTVKKPAAQPAADPPRGPVPLDPHLLKQVAGGAPKGGWQSEPMLTTNAAAPKGGW